MTSVLPSIRALTCPVVALASFAGAAFADTVQIQIDAGADPTPIFPAIYGANDWQRNSTSHSTGYTLQRLGGNRLTSYNWENNASNAGNDWYHSSDGYLVSGLSSEDQATPGMAVTRCIDHANANGNPSLVTLQLAGFVAADKSGTVTAAQVAPSSRWKRVQITKGSALSLTPDTGDDYVYLDELVNFLMERYGPAYAGGVYGYCLDNEPALWSSTHARLHPGNATVAEIVAANILAAKMINSFDPGAEVFGPCLYGWSAYMNFQDAPDWGAYSGQYDWFISAYLAQMKAAHDEDGVRLLDVLDIHYYPEATGLNDSSTAVRITDSSDNSEGVTQARLQAPRSLWDANYTETSWITTYSTQGPIRLIGRLQDSIDTYYPGTGIGITEYDFGGHQNYSGGLAQADVLGIFGANSLTAACYWGTIEGSIIPAFQLYRNYDGNGSTFGDFSLPAANPDAASFSSYASKDRATGAIHLVAINKTASVQPATISLVNTSIIVESARVFGFSEADPAMREYPSVDGIRANSFSYDLPAHSALHFVFACPEVDDIEITSDDDGQSIIVMLKTVRGMYYQLQSSPDLETWTDVGDSFTGDGNVHGFRQAAPSAPLFWRFEGQMPR
jgi:hypothetical protein